LTAHQKAAATKDVDGNLPLHGAISSGSSFSVVEALITAHPSAVQARSGKHTALHLAANSGATIEIVRKLLIAWPEAAAEVDDDGNTPLHFAAASQADPDVVRALLEVCPDAAKMRGHMKRMPLSLAFLFEAPPESVKAILEAHPDAMRDGCITADHQNHGKGGSDVAKRVPSAMPKAGEPQFQGHYSIQKSE